MSVLIEDILNVVSPSFSHTGIDTLQSL